MHTVIFDTVVRRMMHGCNTLRFGKNSQNLGKTVFYSKFVVAGRAMILSIFLHRTYERNETRFFGHFTLPSFLGYHQVDEFLHKKYKNFGHL